MHQWSFIMNKAAIPRIRCIRYLIMTWFSGDEGQKYFSQGTRNLSPQCCSQLHSQRSDQCLNMLQQHWKRNSGNNTWFKKFHHYCFACDLSMITYHKPLVAIFRNDVAMLSQRLPRILLCIQQCNIRILYKPGTNLFITDWLSRHNDSEDRDEEIQAMSLSIYAIDTCKCTTNAWRQREWGCVTLEDDDIGVLSTM